jgi:hypothetical protein
MLIKIWFNKMCDIATYIILEYPLKLNRRILIMLQAVISVLTVLLAVFFITFWERLPIVQEHPILPFGILTILITILLIIVYLQERKDKKENQDNITKILQALSDIRENTRK